MYQTIHDKRPAARRRTLLAASVLVLASMLLSALPAATAEELNALVWCDHTDPALIKPFEEKYGVTVNLKDL